MRPTSNISIGAKKIKGYIQVQQVRWIKEMARRRRVKPNELLTEIIRAGINAVDKGQWEAARSIGLTETHVMTRIILPQAVKNILPALCNEFISTVKGTSLASVFFVGELMTSQRTVQSATFLALESLTIVGIIYFVLNFVLSKMLILLERRLAISD